MKNSIIITGQNFQDEEVIYPYYRLLEGGFGVDIVTSTNEEVKGKYGFPIRPSVNISDLKELEYDLIVLPGGYEAPDRVRQIKDILDFVRRMYFKRKIIASICHGAWIMISAGIVKGKKITGYIGIKDDIINAGAEYIDAPVVIDGNLITSPHYKYLGEWMKVTIANINNQS